VKLELVFQPPGVKPPRHWRRCLVRRLSSTLRRIAMLREVQAYCTGGTTKAIRSPSRSTFSRYARCADRRLRTDTTQSILFTRARIIEAAAPQNQPKFARPQRPGIVLIARTTHKQPKMGLRLKCGFSTLELVKCKLHKDHRGVDLVSGVLPFGRLW
jgi:hypothetical protein